MKKRFKACSAHCEHCHDVYAAPGESFEAEKMRERALHLLYQLGSSMETVSKFAVKPLNELISYVRAILRSAGGPSLLPISDTALVA
jgi:hypothetical protein